MKIETRQQKGYMTVGNGDRKEVTLTIEETYHDDGRKDCRVIVPRIGTKASRKAKTNSTE